MDTDIWTKGHHGYRSTRELRRYQSTLRAPWILIILFLSTMNTYLLRALWIPIYGLKGTMDTDLLESSVGTNQLWEHHGYWSSYFSAPWIPIYWKHHAYRSTRELIDNNLLKRSMDTVQIREHHGYWLTYLSATMNAYLLRAPWILMIQSCMD